MTTKNFDGGSSAAITASFTGWGGVTSSGANGLVLPTNSTLAFNGNRPVYVTTAYTYWAGYGASRSLRLEIGSFKSAYTTVAAASGAVKSSNRTFNAVFQNGGNQAVRIKCGTGNDQFYFGRGADGSGSTVADNGYTWSGSISGQATYYTVPTNPTALTASQDGVNNAAILSWTAPTSNGGYTTNPTYVIHYSTDAAFATYNTVDTGSEATTYTLTGLVYGYTYYFRVVANNAASIAAATTSTASNTATAFLLFPDLDGWSNFGTMPVFTTATIERTTLTADGITNTGLHRKVIKTSAFSSATFTAGNFGMQRTLTGLEIGRAYTISAKAILGTAGINGNIYRLAVTGIGSGSTVTLSSITASANIPAYTFTATATSHVVKFELAETYTVTTSGTIEDVYMFDLTVTRLAEDLTLTKGYWLQDNLVSGSLAEHYDLTMRSIGGYWWVDKNNKTQFAQDLAYIAPIGTFTDGQEYVGGVLTPGQSQAGELHYIDIKAGYDTTQVVNDITVTNEGLAPYEGVDSLPSSWQAVWNQANAISSNTWGTRRTEITTNLWLDSIDNYVTNPSGEVNKDNTSAVATNEKYNRALRTNISASLGTVGLPANSGKYCFVNKCKTSDATIGGYHNPETSGDMIPVIIGEQYTAIGYYARSTSSSTDAQVYVAIRWYDDAEEYISQTTGTSVSLTTANQWYKATVTGTAPAEAVYAVVRISSKRSGGGNIAVAAKFGSDCIGFFKGSFSDYFDGEFPDTTTYIYDWLGDKHQSISRRSVNRLHTRATDILTDFADPKVVVKSFSWNAVEDALTASKLDVGVLLYLKFNGVNSLYRVSGISHEVTPYEWLVNIEVQKVI